MQIDFGFVVGTLVLMVVTRIASDNLGLVWRLSLGLGVVPPLSLMYLRVKLKEPEASSWEKFRKTPYLLASKYYGPRLVLAPIIWFIYDFCRSFPIEIKLAALRMLSVQEQ